MSEADNKMLARIKFVVACSVLLVGCHAPNLPPEEAARITVSLQKRITEDEARDILLTEFNSEIARLRQLPHHDKDAKAGLNALTRMQKRCMAHLDSFLSHRLRRDELWYYRSYITKDNRGGEDGFAFVRGGRVIGQMQLRIYD